MKKAKDTRFGVMDIAQIRHLAAMKAAVTRRKIKEHDQHRLPHQDEFDEAACQICQKRAKEAAKWGL